VCGKCCKTRCTKHAWLLSTTSSSTTEWAKLDHDHAVIAASVHQQWRRRLSGCVKAGGGLSSTFCRAMLCKRDMSSCGVCVSVCLCVSVTFVNSVKTNKHIINFLQSGSHTIPVFPRQTALQYSDGKPLTGASNAGRVSKNRDSEPISGFAA